MKIDVPIPRSAGSRNLYISVIASMIGVIAVKLNFNTVATIFFALATLFFYQMVSCFLDVQEQNMRFLECISKKLSDKKTDKETDK